MYDFVIADLNGNKLGSFEHAKDRKLSLYLNAAGAASFSLDGRDEKAALIDEMATELYIYKNGVKVWAGRIINTRDNIEGDSYEIDVSARGYYSLLEKRRIRTDSIFSQVDQGEIAWALINDTQALSSLGITQGATTTGILRDRTYYAADSKQVKEAIDQLSALEKGFDFEITAEKVFNVFYPEKGVKIQNFAFEWGKNIKSFGRQVLGDKLINALHLKGAGQGESALTALMQDAGSQQKYGLLEDVQSFNDVVLASTLEEKGRQFVSEHAKPLMVYALKVFADDPPLYSYAVGDYIRVRINYGRINIDEYMRIYGIEIDIDENDVEDVNLIMSRGAS